MEDGVTTGITMCCWKTVPRYLGHCHQDIQAKCKKIEKKLYYVITAGNQSAGPIWEIPTMNRTFEMFSSTLHIYCPEILWLVPLRGLKKGASCVLPSHCSGDKNLAFLHKVLMVAWDFLGLV